MYLSLLSLTMAVAVIFAFFQIKEAMKLRAIVYLIVKDEHRNLTSEHWNVITDDICRQRRADIHQYINRTGNDSLYADSGITVSAAFAEGMEKPKLNPL